MKTKLIADSGATKCEWCVIQNGRRKKIFTQGISPYFLNAGQIEAILGHELLPRLKKIEIDAVYFYGTGLRNANNANVIRRVLKKTFPLASIEVNTDLLGAARAVCGNSKGIACILGTGSNSCYYNGKKIIKNSPGLGYILGDEGSGAYLGKKVVQHFLYDTFDEELRHKFTLQFQTSMPQILERVYKEPLPNRYLAAFTVFLAENRSHYMVENIIQDGFNDFFYYHLLKYRESWLYPISFVGSVAYGFKDVLKELCNSYELELGSIIKQPMDGLVQYHLDNE